MRNIFRRAEPEQTSGDIISMQHSSKASGGAANAITNNVIMMTKIPASLQRQSGEEPHTANPLTHHGVDRTVSSDIAVACGKEVDISGRRNMLTSDNSISV